MAIKKSGKTIPLAKLPNAKAFEDKQLSLFQNFLANTDEESDQLSNTIELWDAIPKYSVSYRQQLSLRNGGYLPTHEHDFVHRNHCYHVRIIPARVKLDDEEKEFYPGASEEILENALRKLSCDHGAGFLDSDRSGVTFTIHKLKKELAACGHSRSYHQIHTSLLILAGCQIELTSQDGEGLYSSAVLSSLLGVTRKKLESDPHARWYADFSSLVTEGIKSLSYRQFNYRIMMNHSTQLARWFHMRLAHNFTQASMFNTYTIKLSTVERDSGLLNDRRKSQVLKRVRDAFNELIEHEVISRFTETEKRGPRNSIVDVTFELFPHPVFCNEVIAANSRTKANALSMNKR